MSEKRRGRKPLDKTSWPFGSEARRKLFATLLGDDVPDVGWTKRELEKAAEATRGGIDPVLRGALEWGLIETNGVRWVVPTELPPIAEPIRALLLIVEDAPAVPLSTLPITQQGRRPKRAA